MTKGHARSHGRGDPLTQQIVKQTVAVRDTSLTVDGATGVGWGTTVIEGLPAGNIMLLGAVGYFQFTGPTSANLSDTWNGDYGVGTTPADDATITAGDVNIIPSTAVGPAVAEASPRTRGTQADGAFAGVVLDNTDGSLELNLNLLVDDADIGADGIVMTVEGVLTLSYVVLGDD
jgi:hypothetical protein